VGIGLLIASLGLGYVTGLISTDISAAAQGFRGFLARSRRPASSRPTHLSVFPAGLDLSGRIETEQ
jgi:hypothetical protein